MADSGRRISRRRTLQLTGGVLAGVGITGTASAAGDSTADAVRANVGYETGDARGAALAAASLLHFDYSFDALTLTAPREDLRELAGHDDVRYVERDAVVETVAHDSQVPWGVDRVDAEAVHDDGGKNAGDGVDVAIIDTGIDRSHPDLRPNLGRGARVIGVPDPLSFDRKNAERISAPAGWQDNNFHGTHVAGTVAAAADDALSTADVGVVGVAPDVTLHAVKALNASGRGLTSNVAAAISYVAEQNWDVANISLGTAGPTRVLRAAVENASDTLLVAAAGNTGPDKGTVEFPAGFPGVVAVGATDSDDNVPDFSSRSSTTESNKKKDRKQVDIAAPGVDIYSTMPGGNYASFDGTSFAAPHVAGAAALLIADGDQDPDSTLEDNAEKIQKENPEFDSTAVGAGLLDVAAAVGGSGNDLDDSHSAGVFGSGIGPSL